MSTLPKFFEFTNIPGQLGFTFLTKKKEFFGKKRMKFKVADWELSISSAIKKTIARIDRWDQSN